MLTKSSKNVSSDEGKLIDGANGKDEFSIFTDDWIHTSKSKIWMQVRVLC